MNKIFLWGPSGSGKTWLLDAFIRQANLVNDKLSNESSPFQLLIKDIKSNQVRKLKLEPEATRDIQYVSYTIKRTYEGTDNSKAETLRKLACNHTHEISMLDGPGDETTGDVLDTATNDEEVRARVLAAHEALKSSQYLIVVINDGLSVPSSVGTVNDTGERFYNALQRLIHLNRIPEQKVYLCFTKSDKYQIGITIRPIEMLSRLFGGYAAQIESQLRELVKCPKGDLPSYFVSATGYYYNQRGEIKPNFENNQLAYPEKWEPYNVATPFFDIFDDNEKQRIIDMGIEPDMSLLRILPIKLRNKLKGSLIDAHKEDILEKHVSYSEMTQ